MAVFPVAPDDVLPDEAVEVGAHSVQTVAPGHGGLRGGEALTGGQAPGEALGLDAVDEAQLVEGVAAGGGKVLAAVDQMEAVAIAVVLRGCGVLQNDEGIGPAAGGPQTAAADDGAGAAGGIRGLKFPGPAAVEGGHHHVLPVKIHLIAQKAQHRHLLLAVVDQAGGAGDDIAVVKGGVEKLQAQAVVFLREDHPQCLAFAAAVVRGGEALQRRLLLQDLRTLEAEVRQRVAIGGADGDKALPQVPQAGGGDLQRRVLQGQPLQHGGVGRGVAHLGHQSLPAAAEIQTAAVMQVLQKALLRNMEAIGAAFGVKKEKGVLTQDHVMLLSGISITKCYIT